MFFSIPLFPASPRRVVREESLVLAPQMLKIQTFTVWIAWRPGYFVTIVPTIIVTFNTATSIIIINTAIIVFYLTTCYLA